MANGFLTIGDMVEIRPRTDGPRMIAPSSRPLNLLLEWPERTRPQWVSIAAASVALHLAVFVIGLKIPTLIGQPEPEEKVVVHRIPLYLPPDVMTQREPNKAKVAKQVDLADLMPAQRSRARAATPRRSARHFERPKQSAREVPKVEPQILPEEPKVAMNREPAAPPRERRTV